MHPAALPLRRKCAKSASGHAEVFMAEHGHTEYATADGNDVPAHEAGYNHFVEMTVIGTNFVINLLFGLAIGGVIGHWLPAAAVIMASAVAAAISMWTHSRTPGFVMLVVGALTLLFNSYS
jgi:hypothetical protein